jgi:hypothetical protein
MDGELLFDNPRQLDTYSCVDEQQCITARAQYLIVFETSMYFVAGSTLLWFANSDRME